MLLCNIIIRTYFLHTLTSKWKCLNEKCGKMNCKYCRAKKQIQTLIEYAVNGYCTAAGHYLN